MREHRPEHGPTYRFICKMCGLSTEKSLKISSRDDESKWPICDCGAIMERAWISPEGGFILRGRGWYKKGGY